MQHDLHDRFLRSLTAPETGRLEVSDTRRKGLRYRLSAKGKNSWMYEKRIKGGAKRKHTLGSWPAVSLADARAIALELEAEAARGFDRVEAAEEQRLENEAAKAGLTTLREVIGTYAELHLSNLRTGDERRRQIEQSLAKHLDVSIRELSRSDLQSAVDAKAKKGRKIFANRIRAALLAFAKWSWERGYLDENIGAGVSKPSKEAARERVPTLDEVRAIFKETHSMGPIWGPAFRLLLLTGQRRGDILGLRWSEIDFDRQLISLGGSRTKNGKPHTTHLSGPALAEIELMQYRRQSRKDNSEFVFTTTGTTPVSGVSKAKKQLDNLLGETFEPWRLHDLRTGMATALAEAGEPEGIVDRILNHAASGSAPSAVARVYNQAQQLPQRAAALDRWAEMVTSKVAKVVQMHA